ncbi:hypothetical protein KSU1_C1101 [Candidatus Jettenia caeni]|uniref:Uncharacterized protein n=1 Tax=Candidatus Jettenia caeni TaxID=247490 RepID=I3ILV2_9BACT|nr:hypothetical protein [Candidatus Jettenia sp. AMX1]GAB62697.1 hypothetical protein KSU1_C1101 [Candidatus Jettenia caeni]GIL19475.1 MAG: hypothetical protein BroJett041_05890 [Candidatus Jettenia caeni]GJQ46417.1 MAG: hypothetical protein JETCAE04_21710 [Candidatus Jettenia caeni]
MDKKELILTVAKDLLVTYKLILKNDLPENQIKTIGNYLKLMAKQVEESYNAIIESTPN